MKIIYGFRGIVFELAVRLNNSPIRCKYSCCSPVGVIKHLPLCLKGVLNGVNSSQ